MSTQTEEYEHIDLLGYDLAVGDTVAYPAQSYGNRTHMVVGRLEKIIDYETKRMSGTLHQWRAIIKPLEWTGHRWSGQKYNTETHRYEKTANGPRSVTISKVENLVKVTVRNAQG